MKNTLAQLIASLLPKRVKYYCGVWVLEYLINNRKIPEGQLWIVRNALIAYKRDLIKD